MMIELTQGYYAEIDFSDWWKVQSYSWIAHVHPTVTYAITNTDDGILPMQNVIKPPPDGMIVDHVNRNGLNNRWNNLRFATYRQNVINRPVPQTDQGSGYRGVTKTPYGMWQARIRHEGMNLSLGNYEQATEAARAYDKAAKEYHGEFAVLNFPEDK